MQSEYGLTINIDKWKHISNPTILSTLIVLRILNDSICEENRGQEYANEDKNMQSQYLPEEVSFNSEPRTHLNNNENLIIKLQGNSCD